jgi:hypothetical protein
MQPPVMAVPTVPITAPAAPPDNIICCCSSISAQDESASRPPMAATRKKEDVLLMKTSESLEDSIWKSISPIYEFFVTIFKKN